LYIVNLFILILLCRYYMSSINIKNRSSLPINEEFC